MALTKIEITVNSTNNRHHLQVCVFTEKCFVSSQQIWPSLTFWQCWNCGMNLSATVTNHYFLLLNFDVCNQFGAFSLCFTRNESECFTHWVFEKTVFILHGDWSERENLPDLAKYDPCFSTLSVYLCPSMTDVWAAWAPDGSVTGTKRTTFVSPIKMSQSTTCWR